MKFRWLTDFIYLSTRLGMHRISGRIIRPFLYPVSGRIPDIATGYPVIENAGYLAKYRMQLRKTLENTANSILQSFDFM